MRVSPIGWFLLVVMVGCLSLGFFTSSRAGGFGVLIGALILLMVAAEGMSRGGSGANARKREVLQNQADRARELRRRPLPSGEGPGPSGEAEVRGQAPQVRLR